MTYTYLGNFVWDDLNGNGIQDAGEPGIGGVIVNLLDSTGKVVKTTTTTSAGAYSFQLYTPKPTTYSVQFVAPTGYSFTSRNSGTVDKDSDVDPLTGRTGSYLLTYYSSSPSKNNYFNVDAGLYRKVTIGDRVFLDSNANGIQDAGEGGVAGVTVQLYSGTHLVATTSTDVNGVYNFMANPGTYSVKVLAPAGYAFSPLDAANAQGDAGDSDVHPTTGQTGTFAVTSGQVNKTIDAGLYLLDTTPPSVAIALSDSALSIGETATVTFTFSEAPSGFTATDITAENGLISGLTVTANPLVYTATFTPTVNLEDTANLISVGTGTYTDAAGNAGTAGTSANYTIDTKPPTVAIALSDSALTFGETSTVTFTFSEVPSGFTATDITAENGLISGFAATANPSIYTAIFTPTANIGDTTNLISVGVGTYTDAAGNAGAAGTSVNYTINTLYSPVSVNLSYAPSSLLTSYDATGSFPAVTYLFPEVSKTATKNSFVQRITLSIPTGSSPSAPTNNVTVSATNPLTFNGSAYVELKYVWNDLNNNDVFDLGEQQFNATNQSVNFTLGQIAAGSPISLKAFSEINGDGTQRTQKLTFNLNDVDSSTPTSPTQTDLGAATGELNLLLDQTRFSKATGSTSSLIGGFANSSLTVTVNGNSTSQTATTLLGRGSLTEGVGAGAPGTVHFLAQDQPIVLDVEATVTTTTSSPLRRSDPVAVESFQLVWSVPADANFTAYAANTGGAAFNSPGGALDSLVEFINAGYFSESLAQNQIIKGGVPLSGGYKEPGVPAQTAIAGNLGAPLLQTTTYTGGNFQNFVNALGNGKWKILIDPSVNLSQRVSWSNYSQAANPDVDVIQLPTTDPNAKFKITMANGQNSMDLSQTTILLANGTLTGADILGGNGKDTIRGTRGDDLITGANGNDTFVFGINAGNDIVTDFRIGNDVLDLTRLGLTRANVLSQLDTNGDGEINANVVGGVRDKYVVNGSGASLRLNLSYFSDLAAGLPGAVSNVNGLWNTTTTIAFTGVSSLRASAFV